MTVITALGSIQIDFKRWPPARAADTNSSRAPDAALRLQGLRESKQSTQTESSFTACSQLQQKIWNTKYSNMQSQTIISASFTV